MLEGALEQLLLQFLAPFVDGISRDKLHLGVFSGSLELQDLTVKADALALLGFDGFRIRRGLIKLIKLSVPWSSLYSGKIQATVETLHIVIESLTEGAIDEARLIKEIKEAKQKAIEVRMNQLRDLMEQREKQEGDASTKKHGRFVNLIRKIINNISIHLIDVDFSFINSRRGLACNLDFPKLSVLSTDHTFRERESNEEVVSTTKHSMYKLLHLQELGIKMSPAGSSDISKAEHILTPISASLQLAHEPSEAILRVKLDVATEETAQIVFKRSQFKHLRMLHQELQHEQLQLRALVVPLDEEQSIYKDMEASKAEYRRLYERHLLNELKLEEENAKPITPQDERRKRLLEDAFAARLIARERWILQRKFEALHEEVCRRQEEAQKARRQADRTKTGLLGRVLGRRVPADLAAEQSPDVWLSQEEREQLLKDMDDESKIEMVDLPQRGKIEFRLGQMAVDLIDDRRTDKVQRQLLSLALQEADWQVDVHLATDFKGQDSAEWQTEIRLRSFHASHTNRDLLSLHKHGNAIDHIESQSDAAAAAEGEPLEPRGAAKLVVASQFKEDMNLMLVCFEFMPIEIHFLPGIVELMLDFVRAPEVEKSVAPVFLVSPEARASRVEEYKELSKQWVEAHGDKAKEMAQMAYHRLPDKMEIDIQIFSPIVHVPVVGLGTSSFSLGELRIKTPYPCGYREVDLNIALNHTEMRAISVCRERFDIIQPVKVSIDVEYRSTDEENSVKVDVQVAKLVTLLAPQAVQILLTTPTAIMQVLYPTSSMEEPVLAQPHLERLASGVTTFVQGVGALAEEGASDPQKDGASGDATFMDLLKEMKKGAQQVLGNEGNDLLRHAANQIKQAKSRQFRLDMGMRFDAAELTLSDSTVPVMRFRAEFLPPGLKLKFQKTPHYMNMGIGNGTLLVELLSPRNGAWEPLAERFHLGVELERQAVGEAGGRATRVSICGHEPLLLNFTRSGVQQAIWIIPLFLNSLHTTPPMEDANAEGNDSKSEQAVKYRVVNLCNTPFQLTFRSRHRDNIVTTVEPTGSAWQSLDDWVLPYFANAFTVGLPGQRESIALSLERAGAVSIPGSGFMAEILTHNPSHRVVLLASPLRVHNQTDLTLAISFHQAVTHDKLDLELQATSACDAALLGHALPPCNVKSQYTETVLPKAEKGVLVLVPNAICAVPDQLFVRSSQANGAMSQTWLSTKPLALDMESCMPVEVGAMTEPCSLFCRRRGASGGGSRAMCISLGSNSGVHFACSSHSRTHVLPTPMVLTTVAITPTLTIMNALPIGDLSVRYMRSEHDNHWGSASEVQVPSFTRFNIYNFPGVRRDGIALIARLHDGAPWCNTAVVFDKDVFRNEGASGYLAQVLKLKDSEKGASAGIIVEPLSYLELRLSCPNWFISRAGLWSEHRIDLMYCKQTLPCQNGITLLPLECMEENCELVMRSTTSSPVAQLGPTCSFRMPPSLWCVIPWATATSNFVFCIQADSLRRSEVLGANCKVMTLRPRLVFTNSSEHTLELQFKEGECVLAPGQSVDHHWKVAHGEELSPSCQMRFRAQGEWSSAVACSDATAGHIPFMVKGADGKFEIWSVEVAPVRGAISVSLRHGSEFVAINRSKQRNVRVALRPYGCDESVNIHLPANGQEIPYGWPMPMKNEKNSRSVFLSVDMKWFPVGDVRRASSVPIPQSNLKIVITPKGNKAVLSVEDKETAFGARNQTIQPISGSILAVEIKLSRLGISLIEDLPRPYELLFIGFELLRLEWKKENDLRLLNLAISEAQVDCQQPGRVDAQTADRRRDESLGLINSEHPAVIMANCANGDRAFFTLSLKRGISSSHDILIPSMDVAFDALDITVDDKWLRPLVSWVEGITAKGNMGIELQHVQRTAGQHITVSYTPPPLPRVLQMDHLHVAPINLTLWCRLELRTLSFLPQYMRTFIQVLSFSGKFTLDGAHLKLEDRTVPPHRGSLTDFSRGLMSEYSMNILQSTADLLGKSSVFNVPRVPLTFGMTGVSFVSDTVGIAFGEISSVLSHLTFDDDYVNQQRQLRQKKEIRCIHDGVVEAGKSLAEGVEGLFDVVTKPMEGAKESGVGGFFGGIGKGVAGTVVKPISKIGQALADIGIGIAAQSTPDSASTKRRRMRPRFRQPRLLYSQLGIVRPWSDLDGELLRQLGPCIEGIEEVIPWHKRQELQLIMLLFPTYLLLAEIKTTADGSNASPSTNRIRRGDSSASDDASNKKQMDVLDALEESTQKLFSQGLKPFNTFVYGVQDIESKLSGQQEFQDSFGDWEMSKRAICGEYQFKDLQEVHVPAEHKINFKNHHGKVNNLNMLQANMTPAAFQALVAGFQSAVTDSKSIANWDELQTVLRSERMQQRSQRMQQRSYQSLLSSAQDGHFAGGSGHRMLVVYEFERRSPLGDWGTPSLPTDNELSWRWLDSSGCRHPHLKRGMSREACAAQEWPPCELEGSLFKPASDWEFSRIEGVTDPNGWMYGLACNSSTWDARPSMATGLRKRRWTRFYI